VFEPDRWNETLEELSHAADADGATLVFGRSKPGLVAISSSISDFLRDYFQSRHVDDPREERVAPTLRDGFMSDLDFFAPDEIARDGFYQDFLKPRGYGWHGAALLTSRPSDVLLSFKRTLRRGAYEARDIAQLNHALPYLRAGAGAAAAANSVSLRAQLGALAHAGLGAVLLDRRGRVIEANEAIEFGDGLILLGSDLRAGHRDDQVALDAAIQQALRPEHPSRLPPPKRVVLRRNASRRPLLIDALSLIGASELSLFEAAAMLVITDLGRGLPPEIADLRAIFGLTAREAELAAQLAVGTPLDLAAEGLRISRAHARQRLKVIFQKTDTHRQGELVALLAQLRRPRR
jgi:DNA-binding CsgD family transcriptional regulator